MRDAFLGRTGGDLDLVVSPGRAPGVRRAHRGACRDTGRLRRHGAAGDSQGPVPRAGDRRLGGGGRAGRRLAASRFHDQRDRVRAPRRSARGRARRTGGPAKEDPAAAAAGRLPRGPAARSARRAVSGTAARFSRCAKRRSRDQGRWEISSKGVGGETARRAGQAARGAAEGPRPRAPLPREDRRPASTHSKQRAAKAARNSSRRPPRVPRPSRRACAAASAARVRRGPKRFFECGRPLGRSSGSRAGSSRWPPEHRGGGGARRGAHAARPAPPPAGTSRSCSAVSSPFEGESLLFLLAAGDARTPAARARGREDRGADPPRSAGSSSPTRPLPLEEIRSALSLAEGPELGRALADLDLALAAGEIRGASAARAWLSARGNALKPPRRLVT